MRARVRCRLVASWGWSKPLTALPMGNRRVIIEPKTEKATRTSVPEVHKAYLAGFIDGDGAIMALLERHPAKRFGFRVRIWVKATQLRQHDVAWLRDELGVGQVRPSRACWEWLVQRPVRRQMAARGDPSVCARKGATDYDCFGDSRKQN
jgi:hypothetical protein